MSEPQFSVAIKFHVFAGSAEEAYYRALPYAEDMRIQLEAIEVTDRSSGEVSVFPK